MLGEKAINNRLLEYFSDHYGEHDDTAEWYVDPDVYSMKGYLPRHGKEILFTCDPYTGKVTESARDWQPPKTQYSEADFDELYVVNRGTDPCRSDTPIG